MYTKGFAKNVLKRQIPNIFHCRMLQTKVFSQLFPLLKTFKAHIESLGIHVKGMKILVAVSGGVDSMTLLNLLLSSGFEVGVAHVNFGLRGEESNLEEAFVREHASAYNLNFYCKAPETLKLAEQEGVSIQMAARKLRYDFFSKIAAENNYQWIATAHHADDNLENLFIYLIRNNRNAAFGGISPLINNIIRPLLRFSRDQIIDYAQKNKLSWCEDSSNKKDNYLRNRIRHHIVPGIKEFYPEVLADFNELSQNYRTYLQKKYEKYDSVLYKYLVKLTEDRMQLNYEIQNEYNFEKILEYYFLKLGFNSNEVLKISSNRTLGSQFFAGKTRISITRAGWLLSPAAAEPGVVEIVLEKSDIPIRITAGKYNLVFQTMNSVEGYLEKNSWYFDANRIQYPLTIRAKSNADRMTIFGMDGTKKISDLFIDAKVDVVDKAALPIICDEGRIIGLVPLRRSAEYLVNNDSNSLLKITWNPNTEETT